MIAIFKALCDKSQYRLDFEALKALKVYFEENPGDTIGNGRGVRNLFERSVSVQASRVANMTEKAKESLMQITADDIRKAYGRKEK